MLRGIDKCVSGTHHYSMDKIITIWGKILSSLQNILCPSSIQLSFYHIATTVFFSQNAIKLETYCM
jgi:hypothetical protein